MFGKNRNKKVGLCVMVVTACLVMATFWAVLATPETALAKKPDKPPGGGGGKTSIRLARIDFTNSPRIQWDGVEACGDWEYWDERDVALGCTGEMGCRADVSGGGRLKFFTIWQGDNNSGSPRWLVLNFGNAIGDSNPNPNIDLLIYKSGYQNNPPIDPTSGLDNVKTVISLDRMFKKGATRQPLTISIRVNPDGSGWPPSGYSLRWRADLYITETADPDVRILETGLDEDLADLWHEGVVVGTYRMPLEWTMRLVP
jgi:hypothetical protein